VKRILVAATLAVVPLSLSTISCRPAPVPCTVPEPGRAMTLLEGTWTVKASDGVVNGEITFEGDTLRTGWDDVTLIGSWQHITSDGNLHTVQLDIGEAWQDGVRQRYGVLDTIVLQLAFVGADRMVALQHDGVWTSWTRVAVVPPPD
jgi:hypothetical protein